MLTSCRASLGSFQWFNKVANGTDTYSLAYAEFIPVLVKAVQELSAEVQELKALLNEQEPE